MRVADGWGRFMDAWIPSKCTLCQTSTKYRHGLCARCELQLPYVEPSTVCRTCAAGLPTLDEDVAAALSPFLFDPQKCPICDYEQPPIEVMRSVFHYKTPIDFWVPQVKFHRNLALARLMGELCADRLLELGPALDRWPDALIPVPLHTSRLKERGFDQPLELAKPMATRLKIPLRTDILVRSRATVKQSETDLEHRQSNLLGAFSTNITSTSANFPRHVAILDDVMTTGATLHEAALCVLDAGVETVEAWVVARAEAS